ncbi:DNA cytosine methyltransferase [Anaerobiospirillum sp. NML120449]|uniref:DNA cytosine methyltransferase n=1 Tax=Anaerobiospirillum sp. NML120449 TaxID=2932817 RepID=UPI001FF355AA|nr:DNA cytosine methyltransferase [Anaerobiospirillum sp. NML120449]MCK0527500.1 DNA cytosine methyltransferase [Anaerobiospirillum sp. NML120449]
MKTYISLFSCSGIGCYGFKMEGFECIATNELIPRRLAVQIANGKCRYPEGYICGDITDEEVKGRLYDQIEFWKKHEHIKRVDVLVATPPCQGMSVANHKKTDNEINRNSLVVESIKIIKSVRPRFFIFENVPAFMKTLCTDIDGVDKPIAQAIKENLGDEYSFDYRIINFKNYGACSSRTRTLVIGVSREYADEVSPFELYPETVPEKTLREVIGSMKSLEVMGEIDPDDVLHAFRAYPEHMRMWVHDLKEGENAFDNEDICKKPHKIVDGMPVVNQRKNGDKYRRQIWDKVGPCVHTRNDQLASQNTVHPADDRVFSVRELMRMMTVPDSFRWTEHSYEQLNAMSTDEKISWYKLNEMNIRQCLGEAVPTVIFRGIASAVSRALEHEPLTPRAIIDIVKRQAFSSVDEVVEFIRTNPLNLSLSALGRVAEMSNTNRTDNGAYYTSKTLITEMIKLLPDVDKDEIHILEPSAGVGNFIPIIASHFTGKRVQIDLVDIDPDSSRICKALMDKYELPDNCSVKYIVDDFLTHNFSSRYDFVIGNPPFFKMKAGKGSMLSTYQHDAVNKGASNICSFFLDKAVKLADYVALVFPKFILNTPEFAPSRQYLSDMRFDCIIDFGEHGFPGVLIETVALLINTTAKPKRTRVISMTQHLDLDQEQKYIFDPQLPYWIIYRDQDFDAVCDKLDFDRFTVFRDRQLTNSTMSDSGDIRVLRSRNISDDGCQIIDSEGYDAYISKDDARALSVYDYLDRDDVYLTPNMTYYPRVMKKPKGVLVNGSVAILIPKDRNTVLTDEQCLYFSGDEYRRFYRIARNHQTRSLNVDACSVFFFGVLREDAPKHAPKHDPELSVDADFVQNMPLFRMPSQSVLEGKAAGTAPAETTVRRKATQSAPEGKAAGTAPAETTVRSKATKSAPEGKAAGTAPAETTVRRKATQSAPEGKAAGTAPAETTVRRKATKSAPEGKAAGTAPAETTVRSKATKSAPEGKAAGTAPAKTTVRRKVAQSTPGPKAAGTAPAKTTVRSKATKSAQEGKAAGTAPAKTTVRRKATQSAPERKAAGTAPAKTTVRHKATQSAPESKAAGIALAKTTLHRKATQSAPKGKTAGTAPAKTTVRRKAIYGKNAK